VGQRLSAGTGATSDAADKVVIVNLSGRGDKDVGTAAEWFDLLQQRPR
jgi:tryptophan synthase beta chain